MQAREVITERGGWGVYFSLVLFCGLALVFSMPWATYVKELLASPWQPSPIVFFAAYALLAAVVGLNRGAALASPTGPARRLLGKAIVQVLFGQVLILPYLAYVRVLLPGREWTIPILFVYVTALSIGFGISGYGIEIRRAGRGIDSFAARYGLAAAAFGLPLFGMLGGGRFDALVLVGLSPFGAVHGILRGPEWPVLLVAFSLPLILAALGALLIERGRWSG